MTGGSVHTYRTVLAWEGSTGDGYDAYDRSHRLVAPPAEVELALASDPAFRGNPSLLNPEQLLVAAASSCQLLAFLAVAARARIDVVDYLDEADAQMPTDDLPMRIVRIDLHPQVVLADNGRPRPDDARLAHLTEVAHRECFIANSLRSEVHVHPTFRWTEPAGT